MSPQSILLLLSTCGNLYQAFLLWNCQERRGLSGSPLCHCSCDIEDVQVDVGRSGQLESTSSLGRHSPSNLSAPGSLDIVTAEAGGKDEVLPEAAASFKQRFLHALESTSTSDDVHRQLEASDDSSASSGGNSQCSGHDGDDEHHAHQHDALFFLFNIVVLGTGLLHVSSLFPSLQFTVMLFLLGMVISLILEGANLKCSTGIAGESYMMWMDIDPHLLIFTMLPCLLAGDAMTIDTAVAKRVALQCFYLAGPGVLISAFSVAMFLKYYFDWSFLLSLVTASILCATDPVAVVALLKELGASPVLTVQIQGESLLNDGTAIVLFTVAYKMLAGDTYDISDILMFLVKTVCMAIFLGVVLGYAFFRWVRAANDRFNHACGVVQILLTLSAAYWSFIMAEGVMGMSGVLATVASSLMLAHHMWPHLVEETTLLHFWHCLEELMNIIIFLLAGSLCGAAMVHIDIVDYVNLIVIYIVLAIVRGLLIFISRPLLRWLSFDNMPVSMPDAAVMTWGGLRGAVGLALAIQVRRGKAEDDDGFPQIDDRTAERVLFFVSGIAFLTTIINATTCPLLVQMLGITALPHVQEKFLMKFTHQLVSLSHICEHHPAVTKALNNMLHHVEEELHEKSESSALEKGAKVLIAPKTLGHALVEHTVGKQMSLPNNNPDAEAICKAFEASRALFRLIPEEDVARLDHPAWSFEDLAVDAEHLINIIRNGSVDKEMCKVVNKTFMKFVTTNYQKQIQTGELRPGSKEHDILMTSVRFCLSPVGMDLSDFDFVNHSIAGSGTDENLPEENRLPADLRDKYGQLGKSAFLPRSLSGALPSQLGANNRNGDGSRRREGLDKVIHSTSFSVIFTSAIVLNGVYVALDEGIRGPDNESNPSWLITELFFCVVFMIEAGIKLANGIRTYFKSVWNKFDFFLVVIGIAGAVISIIEFTNSQEESSSLSKVDNQTRMIRVAKVFRTFRFLRIFRLLRVRIWFGGNEKLAVSMQKVQTLTCFVQAHMSAQTQMKRFFVGQCKVQDVEIARCILQSQASVHKALISVVSVQRSMDEELLDEIAHTKERKRIAEDLQDFVQAAEEEGAINAQEAHSILHPMHAEIADCLRDITKLDSGYVSRQLKSRMSFTRKTVMPHAVPNSNYHNNGVAPELYQVQAAPQLDVDLRSVAAELEMNWAKEDMEEVPFQLRRMK